MRTNLKEVMTDEKFLEKALYVYVPVCAGVAGGGVQEMAGFSKDYWIFTIDQQHWACHAGTPVFDNPVECDLHGICEAMKMDSFIHRLAPEREPIISILVGKYGMTKEEAFDAIVKAKRDFYEQLESGKMPFDICQEWFNLPMNYLHDLLTNKAYPCHSSGEVEK